MNALTIANCCFVAGIKRPGVALSPGRRAELDQDAGPNSKLRKVIALVIRPNRRSGAGTA